tara:strand:+ start:361 stop:549 length:189 start_codon:yes stop_codon:yes gene_type:complete
MCNLLEELATLNPTLHEYWVCELYNSNGDINEEEWIESNYNDLYEDVNKAQQLHQQNVNKAN